MPNLSVIDLIKSILAKAENGDITGIAIATTHAKLAWVVAWSMEDATLCELLGSVAILNARLIQQAADGPSDPE